MPDTDDTEITPPTGADADAAAEVLAALDGTTLAEADGGNDPQVAEDAAEPAHADADAADPADATADAQPAGGDADS